MIDSKDISVIVQGPIHETETKKCTDSIRKFLPGAQIILSTWLDYDIEGLDYDVLVLNEDPGAILIEKTYSKIAYNNLNRQLLTTKEGLKKADRKYALKLRSDLILTNNSFLSYFDKFQQRSEKWNLFKRKILIPTLFTRFNIYCRKLNKTVFVPFHISDWWLFGLREDINTYFMDTHLVSEPYFSKYFNIDENIDKITPFDKLPLKFAPEQYFGYSCFNHYFKEIYMEDASYCNDRLKEISQEAFINNFIVLEFKHSGIYINKYPCSKNEFLCGNQYLELYNFYRFEKEYKKYCDNNYQITSKQILFQYPIISSALLRLVKHIKTLFSKNISFLYAIEKIFISIPFAIFNCIIALFKELFKRKIE